MIATERYWQILTANYRYWQILTANNRYWQILTDIDRYWLMLPLILAVRQLTTVTGYWLLQSMIVAIWWNRLAATAPPHVHLLPYQSPLFATLPSCSCALALPIFLHTELRSIHHLMVGSTFWSLLIPLFILYSILLFHSTVYTLLFSLYIVHPILNCHSDFDSLHCKLNMLHFKIHTLYSTL